MKKLLLILAIGFIPLISFCQQYSFVTDTITHDSSFNSCWNLSKSIDVDDSNSIHITWRKSLNSYPSSRKIFYTTKTCINNNWFVPIMISDPNFESESPSLSVERNTGIVHIGYVSYQYPNINKKKIVHCYGNYYNGWTNETVLEDTLQFEWPDIAIDKYNHTHLIWAGYAPNGLKRIYYATNISGTWESQILIDSLYNYFLCDDCVRSITVTSTGIAYISFIVIPSPGQSVIRIAKNNEPNGKYWNYENIESPSTTDFTTHIKIEKDSILHLLFSGNDPTINGIRNSFYSYKYIGELWKPMQYINDIGGITSMEIDKNGIVHATQSPGGGGVLPISQLFYLSNISGTWKDTLLYELPIASIALSKQNKPCFITNFKFNDLNEVIVIHTVKHCDTTNFTIEPIENNHNVIIYPNPFQHSTTIKFDNPKNEKHNLTIFNSLGKIVISIKNIKSDQITLNKGNLESGLYFYRLTKQNEIISNDKMIIK